MRKLAYTALLGSVVFCGGALLAGHSGAMTAGGQIGVLQAAQDLNPVSEVARKPRKKARSVRRGRGGVRVAGPMGPLPMEGGHPVKSGKQCWGETDARGFGFWRDCPKKKK